MIMRKNVNNDVSKDSPHTGQDSVFVLKMFQLELQGSS